MRPGKQRKYRFNAPLHIRHRFLSAHLTKELREKYRKRSLPVRKGDKVKVMRGRFKGTIGEIDRVFLKTSKVFVRGAEIKKKDGTKKSYPIDASKLLMVTPKLDDKERIKALERKDVKA